MANRQTQQHRPAPVDPSVQSADDDEQLGGVADTQPGVNKPRRTESVSEPLPDVNTGMNSFALDPELDARLNELLAWKMQEQTTKQSWTHPMSDSQSDEEVAEMSPGPVPQCVPTKSSKKKGTKKGAVSSQTDSGASEGDRYKRPKVVSTKVKKHKKHKKHSKSSDSSSSESSFPSSDSEGEVRGFMEKQLAKASKKKIPERRSSVRVRSLMRTALEAHFQTYKPVEVINRAAESYTGIKGVKDSFVREMDIEVIMSDQMKRFEHCMLVMQKAVLSALTAIVPVANRMANEDRYTSLATGINEGLEVLAAASTFASFRRFENVFKGVTTEAGKEVTRSKRVKDKEGKEYTLFLPPKPIKGKTWDKSLMFGGQLQWLLKKAESGTKCSRQMGAKRKLDDSTQKVKRARFDTRGRRGSFRGGRGSSASFGNTNRAQFQRNSFGWNEFNRPTFRPSAAQGKPTGFQRGGAK